ncbi:MAG TPA: beta-ketoacyl-ACP synthase III [Polyangiaceae bacterium]|nr:beta-ketoacyl-ACP synthase III [Polyangiaceae bacterium]
MGIRITGVGAYVPDQRITNDDLARRIDTSQEWISTRTGIQERRISAEGEAPSDMARIAALRCLEHAGVDKTAVDLIIVACASPDQVQPAVACLVQEKLGIAEGRCPAFDVNSVCAGFVFALSVAQGMMLSDPLQFRNVLVIGTDAFSKILDWNDRRTCVYFGDGAGAVLLSQTSTDDARLHFRLGSDGRGSHHIEVPAGGTRLPVDAAVLEKRSNKFRMDGPKVWDFATAMVPETIGALLRDRDLTPADLDLLVLHQSNLRMIEQIMQTLGLGMDRTVTTVETYGNTAAASIPITLQKAVETGRLRPGSRVLLCGFGGGLSWGAALLDW